MGSMVRIDAMGDFESRSGREIDVLESAVSSEKPTCSPSPLREKGIDLFDLLNVALGDRLSSQCQIVLDEREIVDDQ